MPSNRRTVVVEDPDDCVVIDHIGALPYRLIAITDPKTRQLTIKVEVTGAGDSTWLDHQMVVSLYEEVTEPGPDLDE